MADRKRGTVVTQTGNSPSHHLLSMRIAGGCCALGRAWRRKAQARCGLIMADFWGDVLLREYARKSKQRVVVTGGAGFLGSHLLELLLRQGHPVTRLDNF